MVEEKINFIINATWEWTDYINSKIGYYRSPNELRTNRAKVLVKVKLPDELKEKHSMFFCIGPHCMFSNVGGGFGFITYAPETNLLNSTELIPPKSYLDIINGQIPIEKQLIIAKKIVAGVSRYIPAMIKAEIAEILFGTVQVEGEVDIFDPTSRVHIRDYTGLRYLEDGFISLSCMKLLYGYGNANIIITLFNSFKEKILPLPRQIKFLISKEINPTNQSKKNLNEKVSMLAGLCFAWFIKARPVNEDPLYAVPIGDFFPNFVKKIRLNEEFYGKNKIAFFTNQRQRKTEAKIRESFRLEKREIKYKLDSKLLDEVWLWFMDYRQIKRIESEHQGQEGKPYFYFYKESPNAQQIVSYIEAGVFSSFSLKG